MAEWNDYPTRPQPPAATKAPEVAPTSGWTCDECGTRRYGVQASLIPDKGWARCDRCKARRLHSRVLDTTTRDLSRPADTVVRDVEEGRREKARGIARVTNAEDAAWRERFDRELNRLAASGREFTSEDVTATVGQPSRSGAVGARMNAAARRGTIVRTGFRQAERVNQHAALVSLWRGTRA